MVQHAIVESIVEIQTRASLRIGAIVVHRICSSNKDTLEIHDNMLMLARLSPQIWCKACASMHVNGIATAR